MSCHIGVTSRPNVRKDEWDAKVHGLRHWQVLARSASHQDAWMFAQKYTDRFGCRLAEHSEEPDDQCLTWFVYRFEYDRI